MLSNSNLSYNQIHKTQGQSTLCALPFQIAKNALSYENVGASIARPPKIGDFRISPIKMMAFSPCGDRFCFGKGIMGAVARGVRAGGGQVIGVIPAVFAGRDDNFACDRAVYTQTIHQRKAAMEAEADAIAILPGGVGTYDEFFEVLVLCTLGELSKPLAVFNPDGCFDALAALLADGAARGLISRRTVSLAPFFAAPEPLLAHLEQQAAQQ